MATSEPVRKRRRGGLVGGSFAGGLRRSLGLLAFLPLAGRAPQYSRLVLSLVLDDRMPGSRKALLAGALGYLVLGRDLVPDDVPILGGLDDLVVVVLAVDLFIDGVPRDLLEEKLDELGIDRTAFDRDIAQIRRLTPGPVRRALRRLPGAVDAAADALRRAGVGPRVRAWIIAGSEGGAGVGRRRQMEDSIG
ncbi:MAG TPA: DUF1232 domain-containing protein [Candidatus Limnocylindrales bacterium]|nr:DUF1232 domain-containing protein [Candidatus Limnocylindrales bacterium]